MKSPQNPSSLRIMTLQPTWYGHIFDLDDVQKVVHACVQGLLVDIPRRLDEREMEEIIQHGSVFVFEEGKSGMTQWTDHSKYEQPRRAGIFLTCTERDSPTGSFPLTKAYICIQPATSPAERWHLVAYYNWHYNNLPQVRRDPLFHRVIVTEEMYFVDWSRTLYGIGITPRPLIIWMPNELLFQILNLLLPQVTHVEDLNQEFITQFSIFRQVCSGFSKLALRVLASYSDQFEESFSSHALNIRYLRNMAMEYGFMKWKKGQIFNLGCSVIFRQVKCADPQSSMDMC
ncbi:hypothetical protein BT69DRAFT_65176 [Atractiella rhizophila]|nr:hypothetical protein BT69DRAFT_65176 [Atractiella rhizophila]